MTHRSMVDQARPDHLPSSIVCSNHVRMLTCCDQGIDNPRVPGRSLSVKPVDASSGHGLAGEGDSASHAAQDGRRSTRRSFAYGGWTATPPNGERSTVRGSQRRSSGSAACSGSSPLSSTSFIRVSARARRSSSSSRSVVSARRGASGRPVGRSLGDHLPVPGWDERCGWAPGGWG